MSRPTQFFDCPDCKQVHAGRCWQSIAGAVLAALFLAAALAIIAWAAAGLIIEGAAY